MPNCYSFWCLPVPMPFAGHIYQSPTLGDQTYWVVEFQPPHPTPYRSHGSPGTMNTTADLAAALNRYPTRAAPGRRAHLSQGGHRHRQPRNRPNSLLVYRRARTHLQQRPCDRALITRSKPARNTNTTKVVLFVNLELLYLTTIIFYFVGMLFIIQERNYKLFETLVEWV
jgi:hypothetical protein